MIVIEMLTWQKESIGLRPQQSMTIMQNRYPGMSTITLHNYMILVNLQLEMS